MNMTQHAVGSAFALLSVFPSLDTTAQTPSARGASAYTRVDSDMCPSWNSSGLFSHAALEPVWSPNVWATLIDQVESFRSLEEDWDGQGADSISAPLIDGAIRLALLFQANEVEPADRVVAGVNGTIFFEWHGPNGYCEIEVDAPKQAEMRVVRKHAESSESQVFSF